MPGRAPLQALQLQSRVHAMASAAASSAARGIWQRCLCELTGVFRAEARLEAVAPVAKTISRASRASFSVGDSFGGVGVSWGSGLSGASAASCGRIQCPTTSRQRSFAVPGSSISGDKFSWDPVWKLNAMPLSTSPVREQQNASENLPAESVISTEETVVVSASASASEVEFAPEKESKPVSPIVQAFLSRDGSGRVRELTQAEKEVLALFEDSPSTLFERKNKSTSTSPPVQAVRSREDSVPARVLSTAEKEVRAVFEDSASPEFAPENKSTPSTPLVQAIQSREDSVTAKQLSTAENEVQALFPDSTPPEVPARLQSETNRVIQPGRIYIGGLPFGMKGDELRDRLRELCSKYGSVTDVNLAQHRHQSQLSIASGKHRGFAFVTMENSEQAQAVIDNLHGTSMWGRRLMVSYGLRKVEPEPSETATRTEGAVVRCKVFVGNLHEGTTRKDLSTKFQQYGTVVDVKLISELHSNRSRGFGFVTFAEEAQAIQAVLDCDGSILDGSVIRVNIAKYPQGY